MGENSQMETVKATKTTFAILEALIDSVGPMGVTELTHRIGVTKSTTYKHLYTLLELGYIEKTNHRYAPSLRFLDFGHHVQWADGSIQGIRHHLDQLAEMTNETAGIVIVRNGVAIDAYSTRGQSTDDHLAYNRRFLHCSAPGKAILAEWSDEAIRNHVSERELPSVTPHTLTEWSAFLDEISHVRDRGFAFERQEQYEGTNGVAVSVSHPPRMAAVYVSGTTDELSGKRLEENIPGVLQSAARKIESDL